MKFLDPEPRVRILLAFSICANVVLGLLLIFLGYQEGTPEQLDPAEECARLGPEFRPRGQSALYFCEARPESHLARVVPNAVYLVFDGLSRAKLEFVEENMQTLREITVSDKHGRPWVDVNLEDGSLIYSQYTDESQSEPDVTLSDDDRDGIPDKMISWKLKRSFRRSEDLTWERIDSR